MERYIKLTEATKLDSNKWYTSFLEAKQTNEIKTLFTQFLNSIPVKNTDEFKMKLDTMKNVISDYIKKEL